MKTKKRLFKAILNSSLIAGGSRRRLSRTAATEAQRPKWRDEIIKLIDHRIDAISLCKGTQLVQREKFNEAVEASTSHVASHKIHKPLDSRLFKTLLLTSIFVACAVEPRTSIAQKISAPTPKSDSYPVGQALKKCTISYALKKIGPSPAMVFCSYQEANPVSTKLAVLISSKVGWRAIPKLTSKGYWEFVGRSFDGRKVWAVARGVTSKDPRKAWHVWHSNDGGSSWSDLTPPNIPSAWLKINALYFDMNGHGELIFYLSHEAGDDAGREPGFYTFTSENEGKNWKAKPVSATQSQLPTSNIIIAAKPESDLTPRSAAFYRDLEHPMQ